MLRYAEPCYGEGDLIKHITDLWDTDEEYQPYARCNYHGDIADGRDALKLTEKDVRHCDYIITNPPWTRSILHPLIDHFRRLRPTFLLFDAPWAFTKQAIPYLKYCSDIIVVGRLKWIPGSKYTSKDDCCWYKFISEETTTTFHGKM